MYKGLNQKIKMIKTDFKKQFIYKPLIYASLATSIIIASAIFVNNNNKQEMKMQQEILYKTSEEKRLERQRAIKNIIDTAIELKSKGEVNETDYLNEYEYGINVKNEDDSIFFSRKFLKEENRLETIITVYNVREKTIERYIDKESDTTTDNFEISINGILDGYSRQEDYGKDNAINEIFDYGDNLFKDLNYTFENHPYSELFNEILDLN